MKKSTLESAVTLIPDLLSEFGNYVKTVSNESLKAIVKSTGNISVIVKIFGKPLIDGYFKLSEQNKLKDYGLKTYLKASLIQTGISLEHSLPNLENTYSIDGLLIQFEDLIKLTVDQSNTAQLVLFFQPKYHPVVKEIINIVETFLKKIGISDHIIILFKRHFYDEIEAEILKTFGDEIYIKHLAEIKKYLLNENEIKLLIDNINLGKIGFKENENLAYETTYALWKPVYSIFNSSWLEHNDDSIEKTKQKEKFLSKAEDLINQYFEIEPENHLEKILFIVADFGKGKSIFLKHLASSFSKKYVAANYDYVPIYFNLRNFNDFTEDHRLGILGSFLEIKYGIKLTEEYFIKKRYLFLIDSLDECGELTSYNIDRVISSIKKIQNVNPTLYKLNKIIITSRPFDDGLRKHLENHRPFIKPNDQGRSVEYYISLYGFKIQQFNNWLSKSIIKLPTYSSLEAEGFNKEILNSIINKTDYNIYENFIEKKIISCSELRRPIFSYMIFQLISNSINFDKAGKIGVYLSFLNLLTKEAKYIHDISYKINLHEQFEARNILHTTAAVWLYNRSSANKSEIKKADICRVLEGEAHYETDQQILNRYKDSKVTEIDFLSHSYFGEKNNTLHFQHQSFAEILLAEYYLKVLLKFSLDEEFEFEQARIKLSIGDPTPQTIEFLKELIVLVKESIATNSIEKRRLLFPLLASLATKINNKTLYCNHLFYRWLSRYEFSENSSNYPEEALVDWPIDHKGIEKVILLCKKVILSEYNLSLQIGEFKTSLFNKEVFFSPHPAKTRNVDKWIALLCGNILYNSEENNIWFNSTLNTSLKILELLKYIDEEKNIPSWGRIYFKGINLADNEQIINLNSLNLVGIDFSNSILKGISFHQSSLYYTNFSNCTLSYCDFGSSYLRDSNFTKAKISHYSRFALSQIGQGLTFPYCLAEKSLEPADTESEDSHFGIEFHGILVNYGDEKLKFGKEMDSKEISNLALFFGGLLQDGYRNNIWTQDEILQAFIIKNRTLKTQFETELLFYLEAL